MAKPYSSTKTKFPLLRIVIVRIVMGRRKAS